LSYHDWDSPTKLVFYLNQGDGALAQSATLSLSKWYFIAAVYGNNNISIYLDGNKIGSKALPIQINKDNNPITIGLDTPGDTEYLKGKLDDIRIYNIALSDQDVKAIFYE
jgi:hypothetical protein